MSGKKRVKKGIESLEKQVALHKKKLKRAEEDGDIGLAAYYEKELENFEKAIEKSKRRIMPKLNRKK